MFYVQTFLDHLSTIHYQSKTIRDYQYLLNRLESFCLQQQVTDITAVNEGMIRDLLKSISNGNPNRKSAYIKICRLVVCNENSPLPRIVIHHLFPQVVLRPADQAYHQPEGPLRS